MPSARRQVPLVLAAAIGAAVALPIHPALAQPVEDDPFDFALSEAYLHALADKNTVSYTTSLRMGGHSKVHPIANDCEMHIAGTSADELGTPGAVIVEPPNLCKQKPSAFAKWESWVDAKVKGQDCEVTGFPRIFTEHATGGQGESNPDHVLELHPALGITCAASDTDVDFRPFLKMYKGMRRVKATTAAECFRDRKLSVRKNGANYEFKQEGGGSCGNFAVVSIAFYSDKWVHEINGGHSAIVRAFAGAEGPLTIKVYSLAGTEADQLLAGVLANKTKSRVLVHGMITYDYFNILRTIRTRDGEWLPEGRLRSWTPVEYPIALVLFGKSPEPPAADDADGDD